MGWNLMHHNPSCPEKDWVSSAPHPYPGSQNRKKQQITKARENKSYQQCHLVWFGQWWTPAWDPVTNSTQIRNPLFQMHFIPPPILPAFALCYTSSPGWAAEICTGKEGLNLSDLNKGCDFAKSGACVWNKVWGNTKIILFREIGMKL